VSARALMEELRRQDVRLEADGEKLHVDAPAGEITEELKSALLTSKQDLMRLLSEERRRLEEADRRGLLIRWSEYPTWIELHDPLTGEWYEVRGEDGLPGVVETADKYRKKGGVAEHLRTDGPHMQAGPSALPGGAGTGEFFPKPRSDEGGR
jgi:hypothetical protein